MKLTFILLLMFYGFKSRNLSFLLRISKQKLIKNAGYACALIEKQKLDQNVNCDESKFADKASRRIHSIGNVGTKVLVPSYQYSFEICRNCH